MSLMDELSSNGVTAEDLEKMASVRLFEQDCMADNIDLNEMADDDIEALYAHWIDLQEDGTKEASGPTAEEVDEAQAKLAEAEYLGRHMARAFNDEAEKIAADADPAKPSAFARAKAYGQKHVDNAKAGWEAGKGDRIGQAKRVAMKYPGAGDIKEHGGNLRNALRGFDAAKGESAAGHSAFRKATAKGLAKGVGKASVIPGGAIALDQVRRAHNRHKGQGMEKQTSFDSLVEQYATQILQENGLLENETPSIDEIAYARAVEALEEAGYRFEE